MESEGIVPLNNSIFNAKMANHTIDIYFFTMSPPSRAALLLMRALGLKHNIKIVNVLAGEQMNPEFIKINPLHTIPVINDGGFILPDSNAIMKYLVDQYAKDDSLFPRDPKKSAIVIQRLFFVSGYLFPRFVAYHLPTIKDGVKGAEEDLNKLNETFSMMDNYVQGQTWFAGNNMTVADFAAISLISTIHACGSCDISAHQNLFQWFQKTKTAMESFGYDEVMQAGAEAFGALYKSRLK
nr:glutathione S-transferase D2-like isoform X1 [Leptinotarsa decemlineata]